MPKVEIEGQTIEMEVLAYQESDEQVTAGAMRHNGHVDVSIKMPVEVAQRLAGVLENLNHTCHTDSDENDPSTWPVFDAVMSVLEELSVESIAPFYDAYPDKETFDRIQEDKAARGFVQSLKSPFVA